VDIRAHFATCLHLGCALCSALSCELCCPVCLERSPVPLSGCSFYGVDTRVALCPVDVLPRHVKLAHRGLSLPGLVSVSLSRPPMYSGTTANGRWVGTWCLPPCCFGPKSSVPSDADAHGLLQPSGLMNAVYGCTGSCLGTASFQGAV
jgi:hypothetical protein